MPFAHIFKSIYNIKQTTIVNHATCIVWRPSMCECPCVYRCHHLTWSAFDSPISPHSWLGSFSDGCCFLLANFKTFYFFAFAYLYSNVDIRIWP